MHRNAFPDEDEEVYFNTVNLCKTLKQSGKDDKYVMEMMSFLRDERVYRTVEENLEELSAMEEGSEEWEALAAVMYEQAYGVPPTEGELYTPKTWVEGVFPEDQPGSRARVVNTLNYLEGGRRRITDYDNAWMSQLDEADLVEVAIGLVNDYPQLSILESAEFEQRSKLARVENIATMVDEIAVDAENGGKHKHLVDTYNINMPAVLASFGPLYGIGKGRVKCWSKYGKPTGEMPEKVVEVNSPSANDYVLATRDNLGEIYEAGHRKFASVNNIFSDEAVIDFVRGWYTAIYPDTVELPLLARLHETPSWADVDLSMSDEEYASRYGPKKSAETAAAPSSVSMAATKQQTILPPIVLWAYSKLKTVPGKPYYLSAKHRKHAFTAQKKLREIRVQPRKTPTVVIQSKPVAKIIEVKEEHTDPGDGYVNFRRHWFNKTSKAELVRNGEVSVEDVRLLDSFKGKNSTALTRVVPARLGQVTTIKDLYVALCDNIKHRHGHVDEKMVLLTAGWFYSLYQTLDGENLIKN